MRTGTAPSMHTGAKPSHPKTWLLATIAGATISVGAATPAFAIAEAIDTLCRRFVSTNPCPWYDGGGPLFNAVFVEPIFTGSRAVIGVIDGLLPLSDHEAFFDDKGNSRIIVEIIGGLGIGNVNDEFHVKQRSRASGVLGAAIADGEPVFPEALGRGVAYTARAQVASVGLAIGPEETYLLSTVGLTGAMFIMANPGTAAQFGIPASDMPDVIVTAYTPIGDLAGDSFLGKVHDAIATMYGVMLIAPAGDSANAPSGPDPMDPASVFRTVSTPASSYNVMSVAGFTITGVNSGNIQYDAITPFSGRGRLDARNYSQPSAGVPGGFTVNANARMGVDISAPAEFLRLPAATGDGDYSRAPQIPIPDPNDPDPVPPDPEELGSRGTAFAAGIIGGVALLVQDAYKALREENPLNPDPHREIPDFSHFADRPRLHNTVVRAILVNSCIRTQLWTNSGNQGDTSPMIERNTDQPLDTTEGGGQIALTTLFTQFQGSPGFEGELPPDFATLDSIVTRPNHARIRDPFANVAPVIGSDGNDPDLSGFHSGPDNPPQFGGGFTPSPEVRPRPRPPQQPLPPNSDPMLSGPILVNKIGWDHARIGPGFIDYLVRFPTITGDRITATLAWNRHVRVKVPNIAAGGTLNLETDELELEHENLDLFLFRADASGNITEVEASSFSTWNTVEHIVTQPQLNNSFYIFRVAWVGRNYNRYNNLFASDVEYGLAWRVDSSPVLDLPGLLISDGDLNRDGVVDNADLQIVIDNFGTSTSRADVNGDGVVDFYDLQIVLRNFGKGS